jgi:hypothetical protein
MVMPSNQRPETSLARLHSDAVEFVLKRVDVAFQRRKVREVRREAQASGFVADLVLERDARAGRGVIIAETDEKLQNRDRIHGRDPLRCFRPIARCLSP